MLPVARRLRRHDDFRATVGRGVRAGRPLLVVHLLPAPPGSSGPARAGFVVSASVGGSVVRHRVQRRLRHLVAPRLDRLPTASRLVVRALPAAAGATSSQLADDLDAALDQSLARVRQGGRR